MSRLEYPITSVSKKLHCETSTVREEEIHVALWYKQTRRSHLCYHIAAVTLYMISHHITGVMIGQTLQVYAYNLQTLLTHFTSTGRDGEAPRHISTGQRVATEKQTDRKHIDGRVTQLTNRELIGFFEVLICLMVMTVPVTPGK